MFTKSEVKTILNVKPLLEMAQNDDLTIWVRSNDKIDLDSSSGQPR